MARQLHHRKKDNKYAIFSTISDDYITEWADKKTIAKEWLMDLIESDIEKIDRWMNEIDKEV